MGAQKYSIFTSFKAVDGLSKFFVKAGNKADFFKKKSTGAFRAASKSGSMFGAVLGGNLVSGAIIAIKRQTIDWLKTSISFFDKQNEAVKVMSELRKTGFIQPVKPPQNVELLPQNVEVTNRIDRIESMCEKLLCNLPNMILTTMQHADRLQLTFKQDYYSIKGYSALKKIKLTFSEAKSIGKKSSKLSRQKGIEIRKVPDEQYGEVNSYHIEILEKVFEL